MALVSSENQSGVTLSQTGCEEKSKWCVNEEWEVETFPVCKSEKENLSFPKRFLGIDKIKTQLMFLHKTQ